MHYDQCLNAVIKFRTDNTSEIFNKKLNDIIEIKKPKLSFFIDKLKIIILDNYNKYIKLKTSNKEKIFEKYNTIFNDIIKFIHQQQDLHKKEICFEILNQLINEDMKDLYEICISILYELYRYEFSNFNDIDNENNLDIDNNNFEENNLNNSYEKGFDSENDDEDMDNINNENIDKYDKLILKIKINFLN